MVKREIPAIIHALYRGKIWRQSRILKPILKTCSDQCVVSMEFDAIDRISHYEYEYYTRYTFPVMKGFEHPVIKMVELHLTESDTLELWENSERRKLHPRLYLRFESRVEPQSYSAGDKGGSIWMEIPLSETVRGIVNLKPIMSKQFGFKFDFIWKVRRGVYDNR